MFRKGRLPVLLSGAAALAAVALACEEAQAPTGLPPLEDPSVIALSVSVNRDSTLPGDTVQITVTATNPTSRRVSLDPGLSCLAPIGFEVRSPDGTLVAWTDRGRCFPFLPAGGDRAERLEFAPGESKQAQYDWSAQVFMSETALPSGVYEVVGTLNVVGGSRSDVILVRVLPVLTLTIDVEPAVPAPGDTVTITATVSNESDRQVIIPDLGSCRLGVWVGRAGSVVAYLTECPWEERQLTLFPQGSTRRVLSWQPEEPGDYWIGAHLAGTIQPDLLITRPLLVR
ncbi:MAG: hypothetical protein AMS25_09885 [Gemmatimonas sp. SM23_52]|nr:MAG: hypothetical protein AMS25_09885 [Gemmatimonas sp. SM23_52]